MPKSGVSKDSTSSIITRAKTTAAGKVGKQTSTDLQARNEGSPIQEGATNKEIEPSVLNQYDDDSGSDSLAAQDEFPSPDVFKNQGSATKRSILNKLAAAADNMRAQSRGEILTARFGTTPVRGRGRGLIRPSSEPTSIRDPGLRRSVSYQEQINQPANLGETHTRPHATAPEPQDTSEFVPNTPPVPPRSSLRGLNPLTTTNPSVTGRTGDYNSTTTPVVNQVITAIAPNLDNIPTYDENNREGWNSYIKKWEILMAPYRFDNEQLALALPGKLTGSAWQSYMKVIESNPNCAKDFQALKAELSKKFKPDNPMQERKLWDLKQGKKSLNDYFSKVATLGESLFPNMDKVEKDRLLASAFTAGLKSEYQRFVLLKGRVGLREALAEAKKLEFVDQAMGHKVAMVDSTTDDAEKVAAVNTPRDPIEPLRKEIEGLAKLVNDQAERSRRQDYNNQNNNNYRGRGNGRRGRGRRGGYSNNQQRNDYYQGRTNYQGQNNQQGYYNPQNYQNFYQGYNPGYNQGYNRYNPNQGQQPYQQNYSYQNSAGNYPGRGQPRPGYQNTGGHTHTNDSKRSGQTESTRDNNQGSRNYGNNERCFRCHRGHPPGQCFAVDAINEEDLPADQFAFQLLNQPPPEEAFQATRPPEDCNLVDLPSQSRRRDANNKRGNNNGRSLRAADFVTLTMICVLGLLGRTEAGKASEPSFSNWQPMNPMICGNDYTDAPQLFKIKDNYQCTSNNTSNSTMVPQKDFEIEIYKKYMLQTMDTAYQCKKFTTNITTQISFSYTKTTDRFKEDHPVTSRECVNMVAYKECSDGKLEGGDGVYITNNPINAEYKYCCKKHTYGASQCSMIEVAVYKRHGSSEMESTASDVSHCEYSKGSCTLSDGSVVIWNPGNKEVCEYTHWFKVKGTLFESHFVSDARDLVLTFNEYGYDGYNDCDKRNISRSDQGLMIRFLTPPILETVSDVMKAKYTVQGHNNNVPERIAIVMAALQSVASSQTQLARQLFWNSYYYTCKNLAELLQIVSMLLSQHPSMSARYLLQRSNLTARAGPGFLQIYPCTMIEPRRYELLPMKKGNCTNYLPIKFNEAGRTQLGYDNVIHTTTYGVGCDMKTRVLVTLNGTLHQYHYNGSVTQVSSMGELPIPNIKLGAQPIQINEIIFSRAHRLNWEGQNDYRSLNHLLATLERQSQVLRAMGVTTSRYRTFDENVVESQEELLGGAFFAFLTGGHVASMWELWTLMCNIAVTILVLGTITKLICVRCCLPRIRARGLSEVVAEIVTTNEETVEQANEENPPVSDPETALQDSELTRQYIATLATLNELRESAPPPYTPIYPTLPIDDNLDDLELSQ